MNPATDPWAGRTAGGSRRCHQPIVNAGQHRGHIDRGGNRGIGYEYDFGFRKEKLEHLPNVEPLHFIHIAAFAQPIQPQLS